MRYVATVFWLGLWHIMPHDAWCAALAVSAFAVLLEIREDVRKP